MRIASLQLQMKTLFAICSIVAVVCMLMQPFSRFNSVVSSRSEKYLYKVGWSYSPLLTAQTYVKVFKGKRLVDVVAIRDFDLPEDVVLHIKSIEREGDALVVRVMSLEKFVGRRKKIQLSKACGPLTHVFIKEIKGDVAH